MTAAHSTPQKYLDDTKNISSIQHGTIDTGDGDDPAGGVRAAPGLLLQEHLDPVQSALQVAAAESPQTEEVAVRKVGNTMLLYYMSKSFSKCDIEVHCQ